MEDVGILRVCLACLTVIWSILWAFGIFCGHLVYFMDIWCILWPFGRFYGRLVYFYRFGMLCQEKSGNPALIPEAESTLNSELGREVLIWMSPSFTF
jgi:hypothetical protein